jgi:hypothetical protein
MTSNVTQTGLLVNSARSFAQQQAQSIDLESTYKLYSKNDDQSSTISNQFTSVKAGTSKSDASSALQKPRSKKPPVISQRRQGLICSKLEFIRIFKL